MAIINAQGAERRFLQRLSNLIDSTVDEVFEEMYPYTQEPAITSSVIQAIVTRLTHADFGDDSFDVRINHINVPDRGYDSYEKRTGIDLYIALIRQDTGVSKGLLIQAKLRSKLYRGRKLMRNQALRMRRRSNESYVWVYRRDGMRCVPAIRATWPELPVDFEGQDSMSVGELLTEGFDCERGDEKIGLNTALPVSEALGEMMDDLAANDAVSVRFRRR